MDEPFRRGRLEPPRRGIATRYEKTAAIHLAGLHIAGTFLRSAW
ncbi:hypothetical protein ACFWIQ_08630 [Kitasatospora sp. NPDC127059]